MAKAKSLNSLLPSSLSSSLSSSLPGVAKVFARTVDLSDEDRVNNRVNDPLGSFKDIDIPVQHTSKPAHFMLSAMLKDYVYPQTQQEHDDLLNKYYATRQVNPLWRMQGEEAEKNYPKYSSKDSTTRKKLDAKSCFVSGIKYDPNRNQAKVMLGTKEYTYDATPDELYRFLSAGSLGREINDIKNGNSHSMRRM